MFHFAGLTVKNATEASSYLVYMQTHSIRRSGMDGHL
jgi:hypothetical protein